MSRLIAASVLTGLTLASVSAVADEISSTPSPFCPVGQFCLPVFGPDVYKDQSIAFRVHMNGHNTLDDITAWLWDNDPQSVDTIRLTIRTDLWDGQGSIPGSMILESIDLVCPPAGFGNPVEATAPSATHPLLRAGRNYWFVAECDAIGGEDPVWAMASGATGFMSYASPPPVWQTGGSGGIVAHTVRGTPIGGGCGPDLTTGAIAGQPGYGIPNGVLGNDDFFYFLARFAAGDVAVADVTTEAVVASPGYGVPNGVITNDDFFFYLSLFAAGC